MPIYEFECKKCGVIKEVLVLGKKDKKVKCEKCNTVMEKVVSISNFQLKGDGWFKDSYSKKPKKKKAK